MEMENVFRDRYNTYVDYYMDKEMRLFWNARKFIIFCKHVVPLDFILYDFKNHEFYMMLTNICTVRRIVTIRLTPSSGGLKKRLKPKYEHHVFTFNVKKFCYYFGWTKTIRLEEISLLYNNLDLENCIVLYVKKGKGCEEENCIVNNWTGRRCQSFDVKRMLGRVIVL